MNRIKEMNKRLDEREQEIERLNKENKILRENAEHNDKVVDKVNWENKRLNNIIKHTDSWIDRTIEIIKQPSEDDTWILERLNSIKHCLKGSDKE